MNCDFMEEFPGSRARAQHGLTVLWRAAQRGLAGQLAAAALIVLPVRAMADDPAPPAVAPIQAPPARPQNPPVPPPQVITAGSIPEAGLEVRTQVPDPGADGRYQVPDVAPNAGPPQPTEAPPQPVYSEVDNGGRAPVSAPPKAPPVDGQWVYTNQYGWVWMPYAQSYTYVPDDGYPTMYVYGSTFGWRWVAAPWIYDYGPTPYWGNRGRASFVWYSRPWFTRRAYVGPTYYYGPRYYNYRGPRVYSSARVYGGARYYTAPRYSAPPRYRERGGGYDRGRSYDRGGRREVDVRSSGGGHSHGSHGGGGHSHGGGGHRR